MAKMKIRQLSQFLLIKVKQPDFIVGDRYQVFRKMAGPNIEVGDKVVLNGHGDEGRGFFTRESDSKILDIPLGYVIRLGLANQSSESSN